MKFVLFVEGHTERKALPDFIRRWLYSRLAQRVGIKAVRFEGWAELWRDAPLRVQKYLGGPDAEDIIGVISLLDLYGPTIYPQNQRTAQDRYAWARNELEKRVGDPRFRHFFAVHETEAWLLSQPEIFHAAVRKALRSKAAQPEGVNFDEPPAKLLDRIYRTELKQTYKKVVHGKALFDKLDPAAACEKCPRLKELLDEMLKMAQAAQSLDADTPAN
ncbi:MAG TPA: DUF4276 family protein [Blastocatellia bacterium]|nr:DUF4276 family protein [Blastocatellia bacterium]